MGIEINNNAALPVGNNAAGTDVKSVAPEHGKGNGKSAGQSPSTTDSVTITPYAAKLHAAERDLKAVPVVDAERVEQLRNAIQNGEYEIDPAKIADKFISLESSLYR